MAVGLAYSSAEINLIRSEKVLACMSMSKPLPQNCFVIEAKFGAKNKTGLTSAQHTGYIQQPREHP